MSKLEQGFGVGMHFGNDLVTSCLAKLGNVKAIWAGRRNCSYFTTWNRVLVDLSSGGKILSP